MLKYFKVETLKTQVYIRNKNCIRVVNIQQVLKFILNFIVSNFRYNISFMDPPLGGFGDISLSDIFLRAKPLREIFTSGNITPNPPRSGSIND
jgi:hypothetical protein